MVLHLLQAMQRVAPSPLKSDALFQTRGSLVSASWSPLSQRLALPTGTLFEPEELSCARPGRRLVNVGGDQTAPRLWLGVRAYRWTDEEVVRITDMEGRFREAAELFNQGQYYACHDVLEEMWQQSQDPQRPVFHGLLQCAVGMHHLLNHNHQGAMMEFGEGLNKLRRSTSRLPTPPSASPHSVRDADGQFAPQAGLAHEHWLVTFEKEASAVLDFIYSTQLEHAACTDDVCVTMDGSSESYQLLGNYGAGKTMYRIAQGVPFDSGEAFLEFLPAKGDKSNSTKQTVRVPRLDLDLIRLDVL